ncbi:L,D-transpeptidase [Mesorhizobium sp. BAC0120]|uniref:L,D-transpeptidase n=1 Tax=Mesorhizobium sp. BAC0120 TaxID=3090670 RepID=UPI00298C04D1|nr:L,D-transpeptidase [Mesorhizobium sp. BAC0120]MDW6024205.1 L,D-transpeptidase [Mesorhizobium sp. BAC0120]
MRAKLAHFWVGLTAAIALAGCATSGEERSAQYAALVDAGNRIPAVPIDRVPAQYHRQIVPYQTSEKPGTIIVETGPKFLYYTLGGGKAIRYGVGVGAAGYAWHGVAYVGHKREWPDWYPTPTLTALEKEKYGLDVPPRWPGGLSNPLGARALYLYDEHGDTLYRLHGTPQWSSIGKSVSGGCIRLFNQDIIDLYNRAGMGAKVIVS